MPTIFLRKASEVWVRAKERQRHAEDEQIELLGVDVFVAKT